MSNTQNEDLMRRAKAMNKRKSRTAPIRKVKIFVSGDGPHQRISSFETVDDVTLADCLSAVIPKNRLPEYQVHIDLSDVDLSMTVGAATEAFRVPSGSILVVNAYQTGNKGGVKCHYGAMFVA